MWDEIEAFDAFLITFIRKTNNKMADLLPNLAIKPKNVSYVGVSKIEPLARPSILDNIDN